MEYSQTQHLQIQSLAALFDLDLDTQCGPYVLPLREVLSGKRYRTKVTVQDACFYFTHGCLMTQVRFGDRLFAAPHFAWDEHTQLPYWHALPEHQEAWLREFFTLPRDLLLFYFNLMKLVFAGKPLTSQLEDPVTGQRIPTRFSSELTHLLNEVGWKKSEA